jgi:hypothetical protein
MLKTLLSSFMLISLCRIYVGQPYKVTAIIDFYRFILIFLDNNLFLYVNKKYSDK